MRYLTCLIKSARRSRLAFPALIITLSALFPANLHARFLRESSLHESAINSAQQTESSNNSDRAKAFALLRQGKNVEALPLLERAAASAPTDGELYFRLGYTRMVAAMDTKDAAARRRARVKAHIEITRAKELGYRSPLLDNTLASLPPDGSDPSRFSPNPTVEEAMNAGEAAFARGDFTEARKQYGRALELEPNQYYAALFIGDMYFKEGHAKPKGAEQAALFGQAGEWFARAIKIDPNYETAYRYWGSALMDSGKMDEALDKVVEAYIAMPYHEPTLQGLLRWAQMNNLRQLSHPRINIPANVSRQGSNTTLSLDPNSFGKDTKDGSNHWLMYGISRAAYPQALFAKDHPKEKTYRHSLAEEASALRMVAEMANKDVQAGKIKQLEPSLANLVKLHNEGLIEAYILLARANRGIAQDYVAYRQANADKLRRYVRTYIMQRTN